ncbi:hypothetical protein BJX63DRAFT_394246 [Aspergillus granulosus]|uniref:Uncharacterized protein n=1 Tax=Aspergillus granulosus TaxID=176169 RepID=A0ABR4HD17_9EURO
MGRLTPRSLVCQAVTFHQLLSQLSRLALLLSPIGEIGILSLHKYAGFNIAQHFRSHLFADGKYNPFSCTRQRWKPGPRG